MPRGGASLDPRVSGENEFKLIENWKLRGFKLRGLTVPEFNKRAKTDFIFDSSSSLVLNSCKNDEADSGTYSVNSSRAEREQARTLKKETLSRKDKNLILGDLFQVMWQALIDSCFMSISFFWCLLFRLDFFFRFRPPTKSTSTERIS